MTLGGILGVEVMICDQDDVCSRASLMSSIMAELINNMNRASHGSVDDTAYQSMLFPAPAVELEKDSVCDHAERLGWAYDCH
jgi:hypothetical protein